VELASNLVLLENKEQRKFTFDERGRKVQTLASISFITFPLVKQQVYKFICCFDVFFNQAGVSEDPFQIVF
jgi:hypothetical protein